MVLGVVPAAAQQLLSLAVAARSPWLGDQVALTAANVMFLGLPRLSE